MKLLSVSVARAMWFMHLSDLNPRGRSIAGDVIAEITTRYMFPKAPTPIEIVEARKKNEPLVISGGRYKTEANEVVEVSLSMYRDALFADTQSSTNDSESFLIDLVEWITQKFGLVDYKTVAIRKLYVSEMYVSLDRKLNSINPKLADFVRELGGNIKSPVKNIEFELGAISFWIDPEIKHHHVPFRLERQVDAAFSENRYYSIAPLETEAHWAALGKLERLLS